MAYDQSRIEPHTHRRDEGHHQTFPWCVSFGQCRPPGASRGGTRPFG